MQGVASGYTCGGELVDVRHGKLMLQCDALGPASSYARRILIREQILRNNNVDYALANLSISPLYMPIFGVSPHAPTHIPPLSVATGK